LAERLDDARQFIVGERTRGGVVQFPLRGVDFVVFDPQRAGSDRLGAVVQQRMAGAAAVPAVIEFAFGAGYALSDRSSIQAAFTYAPKVTVQSGQGAIISHSQSNVQLMYSANY
jgi:hypothetical protein